MGWKDDESTCYQEELRRAEDWLEEHCPEEGEEEDEG